MFLLTKHISYYCCYKISNKAKKAKPCIMQDEMPHCSGRTWVCVGSKYALGTQSGPALMCSEEVGLHQVKRKEENLVSFPSHTYLTPRLEGSSAECLLPMIKKYCTACRVWVLRCPQWHIFQVKKKIYFAFVSWGKFPDCSIVSFRSIWKWNQAKWICISISLAVAMKSSPWVSEQLNLCSTREFEKRRRSCLLCPCAVQASQLATIFSSMMEMCTYWEKTPMNSIASL